MLTSGTDSPNRAASPASLDTFLNPASLAVVGASPDHTKLRGRLCQLILQNAYPGTLYFINPTHREILGRPCHSHIGELPERVDLAIIVVPASEVVATLRACARAQARNALILSSGFAEEGGEQGNVQDEITAIARESGMRVCGPNAEGYFNEIARVATTFSPAVDLDPRRFFVAAPRRCGVIAQSGGLGFALYHRGRGLGLAFSRVITVGNEADLTAADFLAHMVDDSETSVVILFLETIRNPELFMAAAARARIAGKPIIVVKVGRSIAGSRAAASHTGSMAGWHAAYDAAFRKYNVIAVDDITLALAVASVVATSPPPSGKRAAVVTVSGGGGALMADALAAAGFDLPELRPSTQEAIRNMIPSYGTARNPVDVTGQATRTGAPLKTIQLLAEGDEVDIIVAVTTMSNTTRPPVDPAGLQEIVSRQAKPILFYTYTIPSDFGLRSLAEARSVAFTSATDLARAAGAYATYAAFPPGAVAAGPALTANGEIAAALARCRGPLTEHAAKDILARAGLVGGAGRLVHDAAELEAVVATTTYPVAVKIQSVDLLHKTEAGGVRLNVADPEGLRAAFSDVLAAARRSVPKARIAGVLLEPMARPGVEMIIGVVRDPTFGPVIAIGAGGVHTELFQDVTRRVAPVSGTEVRTMLRELRSFPLLEGYRGAPLADVEALIDLAVRVSAFACQFAEWVSELELNPVIVHPAPEGCSIADALIVVEPTPAFSARPRSDTPPELEAERTG